MGSSRSGFRVIGRDPDGADGPTVVTYRLDPATLELAEIGETAQRLLGFPPADWLRTSFWWDRLHPDDSEPARAYRQRWRRDVRSRDLQYRMIAADGRTVRVHDTLEVRRRGGVLEINGVLIDVTGHVTRQDDVQRALLLKQELLRIVVSELAQPVRSISAFADMLERHLAAQRDYVGSDHAIGIRDGIQRLDTLIVQLVRVAQGGGEMTLDELNRCLAGIRAEHRGD